MTAALPGVLRLARFAAAFAVLNTLLTFENLAPGLGVHWSPRLSMELCLGLIGVLGLVAWRGRLPRGIATVLALLAGVMALARYADVTSAAVYGRPLQLYWDGRHAIDALRLATGSLRFSDMAAVALGAIGLGALLLLITLVARRCILLLAEGLVPSPMRWTIGLAGTALLTSFAAYPYAHRDTRWFFSLPVLPTVWAQAAMLPAWSGHGEAFPPPAPAFARDVDGLHRTDVLLIFAESYGVTSLDDGGVLAGPRRRLLESLQARGREVVSARVGSPTFGGGSWLAHAALLSGVDTHRPGDYERLLATQRPSLVSHFAQHGYRTVGWMPGLQHPWPEGAFYGFDRVANGPSIGYRGPAFGGWRVPDQAAIALLQAQELAGAGPGRAPRFVVFPTISTHVPFRPLPPFQPDWPRLLGSDPFDAAAVTAAQAEPVSWLAPRGAYLESIGYMLDWLSDYLRRIADDRLVVIVIGDHQPLASVSGPGASWDVPVHVIGGDAALRARLAAAGFIPGLAPPPRSIGEMHTLTAVLLEAFSAHEPAVASVDDGH